MIVFSMLGGDLGSIPRNLELQGMTLVLALTACSAREHERPRPPQHEITASGDLLTTEGRLREPGWSRRALLRWDPSRVHDRARLREWDFFTIMSEEAAVNLTLTDLGFAQVCAVSLVDFASGKKTETSVLKGFPRDVFSLSSGVEGVASFTKQDAPAPSMRFETTADRSLITIDIAASPLGEAAKGAFTIHRRPSMPYLSLATPFADDPHLFFYEQKIPGMTAEGTLTIAGRTYSFATARTTAVMDWGRGAWPSEVTWRWAGASGDIAGASFAFNFGEGFGDATAGTENLVVHADVAHKLAEVDWSYDRDHPERDWTFRARDGRLSLTLRPIAVETGGLDLGAKHSRLRKAYGRYAGDIKLDDGRVVRLDGLLGFAEEMEIVW